MGHQRVGHLPKTLRWREVVQLLDGDPSDAARLAAKTIDAADRRLVRLANDPVLTQAFWLLTRVAWAARGADFQGELRRLGIGVGRDDSVLTVISKVGDAVRREASEHPSSGVFGEIASLAARKALAETVGREGGTLFGSSAEDLQRAFQAHSTRDRFGELAERFFSDFLARSLRSFVDRELPNHVGGANVPGTQDSQEFLDNLDRHTRQTARIVRDFAGAWYSKHNWESKGEISQEEARRFMAYALRKLRGELKRGGAGP